MLASLHTHELDDGPRQRRAVERSCAVTRLAKPTEDMIRFVVSPQGEIVPDVKQRLPGRGLWVTAERPLLETAVKRNVFARGFKRDVRVPSDLAQQTERLIERAALDALAIAGKAGQVVSGFGKVEAALAKDHVNGVIHAADAADDGVRKIAAVMRRSGVETVPIIAVFTSAQLDLALGRSNVVHAALLAGSASDQFLARCARLERFRGAGRQNVLIEGPEDQDRNE
jgi:predicted RNA-binding protein YlxR (DUF448 family)